MSFSVPIGAFVPDAIGKMSSSKRRIVEQKIPGLLLPGEIVQLVASVERETDYPVLVITNFRLISTARDGTIVVSIALTDLQSYKVDWFNNLSVRVHGGTQIKLGTIHRENDIPRIKRLLSVVTANEPNAIEMITSAINQNLSSAVSIGTPVPVPNAVPQPALGPGFSSLLGHLGFSVGQPMLTGNSSWDSRVFGNIPEAEHLNIAHWVNRILAPNEAAVFVASLILTEFSRPGLLVITTHRLIALANYPATNIELHEEVTLADIESFEANVDALLTITVSGKEVALGLFEHNVDARRVEKLLKEAVIDAKAARMHELPAPLPAPVASPATDLAAKIAELGNLHANGLLTDEEFTAAKAKVLGI